MAEYTTPGVYIEEIPHLPPSIASVDTSIPAFIGYTEKAQEKNRMICVINNVFPACWNTRGFGTLNQRWI
jgi:phage tail sheath protein FI